MAWTRSVRCRTGPIVRHRAPPLPRRSLWRRGRCYGRPREGRVDGRCWSRLAFRACELAICCRSGGGEEHLGKMGLKDAGGLGIFTAGKQRFLKWGNCKQMNSYCLRLLVTGERVVERASAFPRRAFWINSSLLAILLFTDCGGCPPYYAVGIMASAGTPPQWE